MDGILLVNKEKGMSSHDVIYKLRKYFKIKKIGHCGTLDPMATGVLVCLIGKATKLSNYLVLDNKEYRATFKLGVATTTQDLEGEIIEEVPYDFKHSKEDILSVLEKFKYQQEQTPSIYSAIKVNGKKLYEYARNNEPVEIPSRLINIEKLDLISFENDCVSINVRCSSGTYIRTLCFDIAKELGYPGVLTNLERTKSGFFKIEDCYTLESINQGSYKLIPLKDALKDYKKIDIDEKMYNDVKNGKPLEIDCESEFLVVYNDEVQAIYSKTINGISKMIRGLW